MEERHQVLSGIHPILVGDLLAGLDRLGHGDELVVAAGNFPPDLLLRKGVMRAFAPVGAAR
jgi:L-fucose mutarotase/ribose pyranase (RbsD/FucU family)